MQRFSVLAEVLGAGHQLPHRFQRGMDTLRNLIPRPLQTSNGRRSQR